MATADIPSSLDAFLARWSSAGASERANAQLFLTELADLLGVPRPGNDHASGYTFEFPVRIPTGPGQATDGRIDLYRRGCFVLEAKQFVAPKAEQTNLELAALASGAEVEGKKKSGPIRGSDAWDDAMWRAKGQAERYARHLPENEPPAPFLLVVDVGHSLEVYSDFTQAGRAYQAYPDPRSFRLRLADLVDPAIRERLRRIWLDPLSLDPAKVSAEVTREIAGYLAILATSLEEAGHAPRLVAEFLTRCLFCMFAEDVGLLPKDGFRGLLESLRQSPEGFVPKLRQLFAEMQTGTDFSVILNKKLLRFNGGLFEDASVLPLDGTQLGILIKASTMQWKDVEPAIFGTLLERALDPEERHQLGAHYTPRAYVERLVLPTVIEPLRDEWQAVRAAALVHAQKGDLKSARAEITRFHTQLCEITVLDPACGSGNFLYVTLEHLKRLEGEVLDTAAGFGENLLLDLATHSVDPHQFLGLELNPRAASLAELVLWIGYLQWHFRTRGQTLPAEPVLKKFRNIECRDAVLAWDGDPQPARDERGEIVTVWDRRSQKTDLVTGRDVPDETKRVPLLTYPNARPAAWPKADYIVGNPPFLANRKMRAELGDGYVEALSNSYSAISQPVDFVMFFWMKAAAVVANGDANASGLVTTSRIRLSQNQSVVRDAVSNGTRLVFAIPDHPWGKDKDDAEVRVAMTVLRRAGDGVKPQMLVAPNHDKVAVGLDAGKGDIDIGAFTEILDREIPPDLSPQEDISELRELKAWSGLCHTGMKPYSETLLVDEDTAKKLFPDPDAFKKHAKPYRNGQDVARTPRGVRVLDFFGLSEAEIRASYAEAYQYLLTHTKPERSQERNPRLRAEWWLFEANRPELRNAIEGLTRYIVTVENSPTRYFTFVTGDILPDQKLRVIACDDAFTLGVLSTRMHALFATRAGGRHGVRNTPVYNTQCATTFPFPACDEAAKARIRSLGEELDAHRKRVQAQHPGLSLTAMYNVLEALRAGRALTPKETATHDAGLVSVLRQLHDELDTAVATAYGWLRDGRTETDLPDAEILTRLVALNATRTAEEARGQIRYLRPAYQAPSGQTTQTGLSLPAAEKRKVESGKRKAKQPWPKSLAERVQAVERALAATASPVTPAQLAKHFLRAKPEDLAEILETLATLGRAHREGERYFH
ncbi:MAG: hypothetical protein K8R23_06685 [Chthoniobacter sp.]|nr:hypothetical protein [Chthoniobacter sp.]